MSRRLARLGSGPGRPRGHRLLEAWVLNGLPESPKADLRHAGAVERVEPSGDRRHDGDQIAGGTWRPAGETLGADAVHHVPFRFVGKPVWKGARKARNAGCGPTTTMPAQKIVLAAA